jgi:hypothetical protein
MQTNIKEEKPRKALQPLSISMGKPNKEDHELSTPFSNNMNSQNEQ